jgi:hypothetical protein
MSLVVPPEYARDISKHSGFINSKSKWAGKSIKGLFRAPPNMRYLTEQLYSLVSHPQYVHDHSDASSSIGLDIASEEQSNYVADGVKRDISRPTLRGEPFRNKHTTPTRRAYEIAKNFKAARNEFNEMVPNMIEEYVLPYTEDMKTTNPVIELHHINLDFLTTTAEMVIQNPASLIEKFRTWNEDTGEYVEGKDCNYSAESWNDGTWHPEHLFSNTKSNRNAGYWKARETAFYNGPIGYPGMEDQETAAIRRADMLSASGSTSDLREDMETFPEEMSTGGRGPGNRYKHLALPDLEALGHATEERRGDDRGLYNNVPPKSGRRGRFAQGGQFPFWQTTMHQRPYDRDNSEGLSEGGNSDRRVQTPAGYNMTDLTRRSSTRDADIPRQTHYDN